MHLEELDLSHTRFLAIENLHSALYGLSNSTTLKTIKLSNMQEKYIIHYKFNLTWFLEPLQNWPIRHLHLANNSFSEIIPGLIPYTPLIENVDVSYNNFMIFGVVDFLASPFFQETLLHKGLQEVDFSYQKGLSTEEQTRELLDSNHSFPDRERFTNRRQNLSTATFQQRVVSLVTVDLVPEHWTQCTEYLTSKPCEIFSPNCSDTLDYLRRNHSQFCKLVKRRFYHPSITYRSYDGIPCSAIPTVDDIYQKTVLTVLFFPLWAQWSVYSSTVWILMKKRSTIFIPKCIPTYVFIIQTNWNTLTFLGMMP